MKLIIPVDATIQMIVSAKRAKPANEPTAKPRADARAGDEESRRRPIADESTADGVEAVGEPGDDDDRGARHEGEEHRRYVPVGDRRGHHAEHDGEAAEAGDRAVVDLAPGPIDHAEAARRDRERGEKIGDGEAVAEDEPYPLTTCVLHGLWRRGRGASGVNVYIWYERRRGRARARPTAFSPAAS
jgi:hypothetical protein